MASGTVLPGSSEFTRMCNGIARARKKPYAWVVYVDQSGLAYNGYGERVCGLKMRTGWCNMEPGHRGRHTTVAWSCDGCGKTRRSQPSSSHPDAGTYCFMCAGKPARDEYNHFLRGSRFDQRSY